MISKLNKIILYLYSLCGVVLIIYFTGAGMDRPVGYGSPRLRIIGWILFIALISAHITLRIVKKKDRRKHQKN